MRSWNWPCISPQTVTGHFYMDVSIIGVCDNMSTYHWLYIRLFLKYFSSLRNVTSHSMYLILNVLYRKVSIHHSQQAVCSSSNSQSIRPMFLLLLDLIPGIVRGVARAYPRPHPFLSPWWTLILRYGRDCSEYLSRLSFVQEKRSRVGCDKDKIAGRCVAGTQSV